MPRPRLEGLFLFVTILVAVLGPASASPQETTPVAETFEQERAAAEALSRKGNWDDAREAWLRLLRVHAGADYVRPSLPEIREALRRAAFWSEHQRPDPKELVSGQLKKYSRTAGKLRIIYEPRKLDDFESVANYQLHPLHFRGGYTVEIEGHPVALAELQLLVAMEDQGGYLVQAGDRVEGALMYTKHQLARLGPDGSERLDLAEPRERKRGGEPKNAKLKVSVSGSAVKVTYNGHSILSARKETEVLGRVGLSNGASFDKFTIDGPVEISWIENLIDASVQDDWEVFEETYEEPSELAAWGAGLAPKRSSRELSELVAEVPFPEPLTRRQNEVVKEVYELIKTREPQAVVARLDGVEAEECSPATREFLLLTTWLHAKRYDRALEHLEALSLLSEPSSELRIVEVILYRRAERRAEGIAKIEALLGEERDDPALYAELAEMLLVEGQLDAARERVDAGLAIAPTDVELVALRRQVAKASQGPSWNRAHRAEAKRFDVSSDINPRITRIVAREADAALSYYARRFGELPMGRSKPKIYLFSGSSSYSAYVDGVAHDSPENTAGVFSPRLKQILVWNQPDRTQLLNVLRHEVMHVYTDAVLGTTPPWFNEGLAEYFAAARQEDGRWKEGGDDPEYLASFERYGMEKMTLDQLLYREIPSFMRNAEYCYPVSWAFVDFLLNSTGRNRKLFNELWKTLEGGIDPGSAVHLVFDDVDLDRLNREFWQFVKDKARAR